MPLGPRRIIGALSLLLGAGILISLGWGAQAVQARRAAAGRQNIAAFPAAPAVLATTIVVNSTADTTANDGACTLREAVQAANTNTASGAAAGECAAGMAGADTIIFSVSGTITLTAGQLVLGEEVTITGPGASVLTVSGNNASRVFNIPGGSFNVTLSGLSIANGRVSGDPAQGGGILHNSSGTLTISDSTLTGNVVAAAIGIVVRADGGGLANIGAGIVKVINSTFNGNAATVDGGNDSTAFGGGIANTGTGVVNVTGSTLAGNTATGSGGNVDIDGFGGGIANTGAGVVNVTNSTLSSNIATGSGTSSNDAIGGGIYNGGGVVNVTNSTLTNNAATSTGGGVGLGGSILSNSGVVNIKNTIIAQNTATTAGPDIRGNFTSQGYNFIGNNADSIGFTNGVNNDQVGTTSPGLDPQLGPLANNGGPTQTRRPLAGSPVIDKGMAATDPATGQPLTTDQRGFPRPQDNPTVANAISGNGSDIGAVELFVDSGAMSMLQLTVDPTANPSGAAQELITALNQANDDPAATIIKLICGTYTLTGRGDPFNYYGFNGLPVITTPVIIQGNGAVIERSTAMSTPTFRLFAVARQDPTTGAALAAPGSLTLRQVTLRGGLAQGGSGGDAGEGGGGGGAGLGGAVYNQGTLNIEQSTLTNNTAQGGKGGNGGSVGISAGGEGGGGGGLGGNGGTSTNDTEGGSGGGGFGGNGGLGAGNNSGGGGEGGGRIANGNPANANTGGSGGSAEGGDGGNSGAVGSPGGFGGGGGGGGDGEDNPGGNGGNGGIGGGGGGAGEDKTGGNGGFGGGGGGGDEGGGGSGGFGGGGGGSGDSGMGGDGGFGGGTGGDGGADDDALDSGGGGGAGLGGALFNDGGILTLTNSTLSGNQASGGAAGTGDTPPAQAGQGLGGGIFSRNGTVTINNATLNNNSVAQGTGAAPTSAPTPEGGSLYTRGEGVNVMLTLSNSILANTPGGLNDFNVSGAIIFSGNNNLIEMTPLVDPGSVSNADPQLGALTTANCAASGCRTPVHTITMASPAFNMAGGNAEATDQCGTARPQGTAADIGAYELPIAAPTLSKAFNPTSIAPGATSTLTITLSNSNAFALTGAAVTDTLPAGLTTVAGTAATTCGGMAAQTTGAVSLSGGTIPAAGSCTLSVNVTGVTGGMYTNTIPAAALTTSAGVSNTASATATLTITPVLPPTIGKAFGAPIITLGGTTSLTFAISNPNPSLTLTGVAFTDTLPAGLIVATPNGLTNSCGGTVTAVSASSTISLSGGTVAAGGACTIVANVMSMTLGAKENSVTVTSTNGGTGNTATASVTVTPATSAPIVTIVDPFACTGPGDLLTVTVTITNPAVIAQPITFTSTLPAGLVGIPGTGTSTVGDPPTVTATGANSGPTVLAAGQTATVTYQVQVGDAASGAQLCISTASTFSGADGPPVQACTTINCPAVGPGLPFPSTSEVSDQKPGSVLVYNLYSSNAAAPNSQNTRLSITNTNPAVDIAVHLFFVDGQTCSIADAIICLTKNQTASFLASDLDPGTTGYLVAVASDLATGCPVNFNFLIGDAYVKLSSGHQANLGAEAFAALAGGPVACDGNSLTAQLNFDGVSYNRAPRTLAASSIPARNDGNDTLLILNRFGGNLATGASTLSNLFGNFYDDAENGLSFTFSPGTCQFRSSLSSNFPRTTPRLETFIPAGRSGWLRLYSQSDQGLLGAILNFNPSAGTAAGAFNQGRNLHKLTLTATQTLVIPIFPPNCLD